jgi:NADH:ubiquinone reductase (non-electrogenic)
MKNITIIGLGWASIGFVQYIDKSKYNIKIISDQSNFLYTPLLTNNTISKTNITININKFKGINYVQNKIDEIDFSNSEILGKKFDYLIFSHGAEVNTFNIPGVLENSYQLKTLENSIIIRNKFNNLPYGSTIAIIGSGLVGTELIGNLIDKKNSKLLLLMHYLGL